jgi:tripartite-type tricarboxylate transporter receptor subunit TctC
LKRQFSSLILSGKSIRDGDAAMKKTAVLLLVFAVALSASLTVGDAWADDYPSRPIKMIVPLPAGGGIDITARITAEKLSEVLGQQVIIQNQGGAGGALGTAAVAKSEPDGYTLLYHSTSGIVVAAVTKNLPYDWFHDLVPVSIATRFAPVMIASPTLPVKNLKEFIALLKENPGKYSYASSGPGTAVHLAVEFFEERAGVQMVHVPYRGTASAFTDIMTGRVAMMVDGVPAQSKNILEGRVLALAVTTEKRSPAVPDVPTMKESGLDYVVPFWTAVYAPANTPKAIVGKLSSAFEKTMKSEQVTKRLAAIGTEAVGSTAAELAALDRQQYALYHRIVEANPSLIQSK